MMCGICCLYIPMAVYVCVRTVLFISWSACKESISFPRAGNTDDTATDAIVSADITGGTPTHTNLDSAGVTSSTATATATNR